MYYEVDPSEIGEIHLALSGNMVNPYRFSTHAQIGDGYIALAHHTLAGLVTAFKMLNPEKETSPQFYTDSKYLFLMRGKRRVAIREADSEGQLYDQMDMILSQHNRKSGTFELEDMGGNIETRVHKRRI